MTFVTRAASATFRLHSLSSASRVTVIRTISSSVATRSRRPLSVFPLPEVSRFSASERRRSSTSLLLVLGRTDVSAEAQPLSAESWESHTLEHPFSFSVGALPPSFPTASSRKVLSFRTQNHYLSRDSNGLRARSAFALHAGQTPHLGLVSETTLRSFHTTHRWSRLEPSLAG